MANKLRSGEARTINDELKWMYEDRLKRETPTVENRGRRAKNDERNAIMRNTRERTAKRNARLDRNGMAMNQALKHHSQDVWQATVREARQKKKQESEKGGNGMATSNQEKQLRTSSGTRLAQKRTESARQMLTARNNSSTRRQTESSGMATNEKKRKLKLPTGNQAKALARTQQRDRLNASLEPQRERQAMADYDRALGAKRVKIWDMPTNPEIRNKGFAATYREAQKKMRNKKK